MEDEIINIKYIKNISNGSEFEEEEQRLIGRGERKATNPKKKEKNPSKRIVKEAVRPRNEGGEGEEIDKVVFAKDVYL